MLILLNALSGTTHPSLTLPSALRSSFHMNCDRIDLNLLYELRDSGRLNEDDQGFVLEMIQLFDEGKQLNRTQILRIRDLCLAQQ